MLCLKTNSLVSHCNGVNLEGDWPELPTTRCLAGPVDGFSREQNMYQIAAGFRAAKVMSRQGLLHALFL